MGGLLGGITGALFGNAGSIDAPTYNMNQLDKDDLKVATQDFTGTEIPTNFGGQGVADAYGTGTQAYNQSLQQGINTVGQGIDAYGQSIGALDAGINTLGQGLNGYQQSIDTMGQGLGALQGGYEGAQEIFNPYMQQAQKATGMQAAMSGAMGPEAQQQAMSNIQASPGQDYIRDQMRKSMIADQKFGSGAGGGRAMLSRDQQAGGWAMQDIDNQFNRLGQVAAPGLAMTNTLGGMRQGLGQGQANIYGQQAGIMGQQQQQNANIYGQQAGMQGQQSGVYGQQSAQNLNIYGQQAGMQGQQGLNNMQGGLGAAGAQQQEIKDIYGANLADSTAQNQWNLGQQGVEFQNVGNVLDSRKVQAGLNAASAQNEADMIGGAMSGIGAVIGGISDRRLKENIVEKGTGKNGLNLYEYNYIGNDDIYEGYMADEVMQIDPNNVFEGTDGFYRVGAEYAPVRI